MLDSDGDQYAYHIDNHNIDGTFIDVVIVMDIYMHGVPVLLDTGRDESYARRLTYIYDACTSEV